jgi:hypoxanthine phosphoribosyltransferase
MEFELPSWTEILESLKDIALKIIQARKNINIIVSIGRGGNCPSRILSDYLNVQTLYNINVRYYKDIKQKTELPAITQPLIIQLTDKNVLICDDVSDSGNSLKTVKKSIQDMGCASLITATIYIKPWTKAIPDFYSKQTRAWIVFPWEIIETIDKLTKSYEGDSLESIRKKLALAGFTSDSINLYFALRESIPTQ